MPKNVSATPLMSADLEHIADQVIAVLPFPWSFMPRKYVVSALGHITQFIPPDLVQVLVSAIDGMSDEEIQVAGDLITREVVEYIDIPMLPENVEWQVIHPVVVALLTYAVAGKSLTLWRADA